MSNSIHPIKFFFCGCPQEPDYRNLKVTVVATAALGLIALGVTLSLMYHPAIGATCSVGLGLGIYAILWRLRAEDGCCPLFWFSRVEPSLDEDEGVMSPIRPNNEIDPHARLGDFAAPLQGVALRMNEQVGVYGNRTEQEETLKEIAHKLKATEFLLIHREGQWATQFVLSRVGDECVCSPLDFAILAEREQVDLEEFKGRPEYVIKQLEVHLKDGEYVRVGFNQYHRKFFTRYVTLHTAPENSVEVDLETLYARMNGGATIARTDSQESLYFDPEG